MEGRNFILGLSLQRVRARARAAIHPTCSRRGSPPRASPRLPSAAASSPPTSHRPDDLQGKKKGNNQEVDENKAREEGSVRFGSVRLATRRKSSSGTVFTRTWSTSVDLLRRSETSLMCRRPGAPSIIGARACV